MAPRTIDLNADVGEATDAAGIEVERALLGLVTSAHVACGGHAGDDDSMAATVEAALAHSVRVGAHPSYPDRPGFGREPMDIDREALRDSLSRRCATSIASAAPPVLRFGRSNRTARSTGRSPRVARSTRPFATRRAGLLRGPGAVRVAVRMSRHGHGAARRPDGLRGRVLRPRLPFRRRPGRPSSRRRRPRRSRGSRGSGTELGPRRGRGQ